MTVSLNKRSLLKVLAILLLTGGILLTGFIAGYFAHRPITQWAYQRQAEKHASKYLNKPAPDFEGRTLDRVVWKLSDHRGKVVVIDFMASWCGPCVGSYPVLKNVHRDFGDRVVLVAISLDMKEEDLREHLELYEIPWPTLFEAGTGWNNSIARQYGITAIPSIWIIDPQGRVASLNAWGKQLTDMIEELIGETG